MAKRTARPKSTKQVTQATIPDPALDANAALTRLIQGATRKVADKQKDRWQVVVEDEAMREDISIFARLHVLTTMLGKTKDQHDRTLKERLLRTWVARMWEQKAAPDNPRFILKKTVDGRDSQLDDISLIFQVQFRSDGISVPSPDQLPLGETPEDKIVESLLNLGMSRRNAVRFVQPDTGEVIVEQRLTLADSFDKLQNAGGEKTQAMAKILLFMAADSDNGVVETPALTPEERAACLVVKQQVTLKSGFFERAFSYCDNVDQLYKLMVYVKAKLQLSHVAFGLSDRNSEKQQRILATATEYISFDDDEMA